MLTRHNDQVAILDTMAVGFPGVVAAYLIHGKENALIDMGYASSLETIFNDIPSGQVHYLLPTHVHLDHCGSCGALAHRFPSAAIRAHPIAVPHLVDPEILWEGAGALFGEALMERYGKPDPISSNRISAVADNDLIDLGNGLVLRAIWTPGHASHHLSYVLEGTGMVFTGDAVGITYPNFPILIPTTPPTSFNLESAVESLRRIKQTSPRILFTPHFGILGNAESAIDENIRSLRDWVGKIDAMLKSGKSPASITTSLTQEILEGRGASVLLMPGYAQLSIKISVLGAVRYLSRSEQANTPLRGKN